MRWSDAKARLKRMVAWDASPTLTDSDIEDLLTMARRADRLGNAIDTYREWEPETAYAVGDRVIPSDLGYFSYVVTVAGTSGATEPTWADGVTDGTVTWAESDAASWLPSYDLAFAAAEGWRWKAAAAANLTQFSADGASYHDEQIIAHCTAMAKQYASRVAGTISVARRG